MTSTSILLTSERKFLKCFLIMELSPHMRFCSTVDSKPIYAQNSREIFSLHLPSPLSEDEEHKRIFDLTSCNVLNRQVLQFLKRLSCQIVKIIQAYYI